MLARSYACVPRSGRVPRMECSARKRTNGRARAAAGGCGTERGEGVGGCVRELPMCNSGDGCGDPRAFPGVGVRRGKAS